MAEGAGEAWKGRSFMGCVYVMRICEGGCEGGWDFTPEAVNSFCRKELGGRGAGSRVEGVVQAKTEAPGRGGADWDRR